MWGWLTYDPVLNLLYYGTSNPGPWIGDMRPGDNKYTSSILARDPDTGEFRWALQVTPHDLWDYDAVNENILADLPIHGATRHVLVHFDRNGFAYTIDRQTGEVLVAASFVPVNWASGIDLATGRPRVNPDKVTGAGRTNSRHLPEPRGREESAAGGLLPSDRPVLRAHEQPVHGFHRTSPDIHRRHALHRSRRARDWRAGGLPRRIHCVGCDDRAEGMGHSKEPFPVWSGALATAGNVVFYGTLDGWFKAVDARTGSALWSAKVSSGIIGNPVTYRGPDGRQYVAVFAGIGGDMGWLIGGDVASDASFDVRERSTTLPELARYTSLGGAVFVYGLQGP